MAREGPLVYAIVLSLALVGCGPVILGEQAPHASDAIDGSDVPELDAWVAPTAPAVTDAGERDFRDASMATQKDAARLRDAAPGPDAAVALLCLRNRSFEGFPAFNMGRPELFDALPWNSCTNDPSVANTPDVSDDSLKQPVADVPKATQGVTFLGLAEGEQASQTPCGPVESGMALSFQIDVSRIHVNGINGSTPDDEAAFLEIWGGDAADCSQRELLWQSPQLQVPWRTFCVTIAPLRSIDNLTLRSRSDGSLPSATYVTVDNIVPVERCP